MFPVSPSGVCELRNYGLTFTGAVSRVKELAHDLRLDEDEEAPEEGVDADTIGGVPVETSDNETLVATEDPETAVPPQQTSDNGAEPEAASPNLEIATEVEETIDTVSAQELTNGGWEEGWGDAISLEAETPAVEEGKALTESTGNVQSTSEPEKTDERVEGGFRDVSRRDGRERGDYRNRYRSRGRGRGGYRGDRGGGEHRGDRRERRGDRGDYRGDRGERRSGGRGRGYRGSDGFRGGDGFRGRGDSQQTPPPATSS